ncbi:MULTISPECIES: hypothetical protein [Moraxella]|uniref:Uncharacterized protein n=1 Tax=Moraxella catarrhalis TaxID=480 RepID=A0A7Z0UY35_MORCA|nr:hypothetical protein [Moraxella catarrhalis]OAV00334.1 hypothetical protein AO382_1484 [Moraxella catarrhalis]
MNTPKNHTNFPKMISQNQATKPRIDGLVAAYLPSQMPPKADHTDWV